MKLFVVIACICIFTANSFADAPHFSSPIPTAPGQTRLRYLTTVDGKPEDWCVVFSNSKKIAESKGPVPVLLFLCGVGDRGTDGGRIFDNGPAAEMQRHDDLNDQLPMMVVSPQCPEDHQWGDAGMDAAVLQLVDLLVADPRVDRDRIYLSGLSMGGKGVWHVAAAGPKYFAAIAAVASMTVPPETVVPAIKGLPIWIIVGGDDGRITKTSHEMADALVSAKADVVISELPGVGHQSWEMVYPKLDFYDWLLSHARGKEPTKKFTSDELLKIASAHIDDPVNDKVVKDFGVFCPYWQIVNCSRKGDPGLRAEFNGKKNVMVVLPLTAQTACRMQTTWKIPAEAHAHLKIIAGRGEGDWRISVHADEKEIFSKVIDQSAIQNGWLETNVDLAAWTGKSCHLDVFISQVGEQVLPAYLGKLVVEW